jgi:[acyl-carrier-protein] S-malonyltransferase
VTVVEHHHGPDAIGYLDGRPVPRTRLEERLARLRSGTRAALLPVPGSAEDRQLARWVAQVIMTEELCTAEADRLGLATVATPDAAPAVAAVELGSILAAAWANSAAVRAVFVQVTTAVEIDEADLRRYWQATASAVGGRWLLRHRVHHAPLRWLGRVGADRLPAAIAAALGGRPVGTQFEVSDAIGRHTVIVDAWWPARAPDYAAEAPRLRAQLLASARRAAFVRWLDAARADRVVSVTGLEHPGDPHQPDNHHKH